MLLSSDGGSDSKALWSAPAKSQRHEASFNAAEMALVAINFDFGRSWLAPESLTGAHDTLSSLLLVMVEGPNQP